jgi:esterase/lipase superfamily enzyme
VTLYVTVRAVSGYGPAAAASCVEAQPAQEPAYRPVSEAAVRTGVAGRHVILAAHGFNVSRKGGVNSLAALEAYLKPRPDEAFFGVLWPGDWWIPVINYSAEADDAVDAGRRLAAYVDANMGQAASINLVSHSLGGRVVLEAAARMRTRVRQLCLTAGAVDNDVLSRQYAAAKRNARRISVLASRKDRVLRLAYPLGDFGSDVLFGDDDSPWRGALGLKGPKPREAPPAVEHRQIPDTPAYGHGDYFPPGKADAGAAAAAWNRAADYIRRALDGAADSW